MAKGIYASKNPIEIKISVLEKDGKKSLWYNDHSDSNDSVPPDIEDASLAERYIFKFRYPNWQDELIIEEDAMLVANGVVKLNAGMIRFKRFQRLILECNYQNGNEIESIPVGAEQVGEIDPDIASLVMDKLDRILGKA